jgi:xanthine dehydrogenase molybdenum-binding subunit
MSVAADQDILEYKVIGRRPIRHDGVDKVTGRALYGADVRLPGLLYGKVLRSPHAHARIRRIDTSKALALPGVRAVATGADLPSLSDTVKALGEGSVNLKYQSAGLLADDKVLFHGHPVAAVAATSVHIAEEALALIEVDYEVLPPVLDVRAAMQENAPILLDGLRTRELGDQVGKQRTNVAEHIRHQRGDLARGFAEADVIVEREFTTSTVHQGYIEPQNATALWNSDGTITIWTSTQGAHSARDQVAEILTLPITRIKVVPMEIGGGFGGKIGIYLEPVAAVLSLKAGHKPVKLVMNRAEVLMATGPTSGSAIRVKMGVRRDGRITAAEVWMAYEAGAYPGSPVGSGMNVILSPYRIDNLQIDGYDVLVNKPRSAAYRAPGGTNAAYAAETVIDELAEKIGMDPLAFRLLNGAREGDRRGDGPAYRRIGYLETVKAIQESDHYRSLLEGPNRGRGVASGYWGNWGGKSSVSASVNADGQVNLVEGSTDIGGSRTSIAMQLAETLGISEQDVKPYVVDTDSVAYNDVTGGSRTTFGTGWAVYELGVKLKEEMIHRVAELWEVEPEQVTYADGVFAADDHRLTFKEAALRLNDDRPIMASATTHAQEYGPGFATHVVDVEVDPETGKVTILRYTAAQDVGKAVHPSYVEGQIQGGVAQGIGWALNEEYVYDRQGHLVNANLLDYRMPVAPDLPMIDTILVEVANPGHPYGVRGVGEVPIVPPAGAVANAIYHAVGVRPTRLPMSPAQILEALWAKQM